MFRVPFAQWWIGLHQDLIPYIWGPGPPGETYQKAFSFPPLQGVPLGSYSHRPTSGITEAKAIGAHLAATRFQNPRRDGHWEPISREYVDDVMLMAPDIGLRPELTMFAAEKQYHQGSVRSVGN